MDGIPTEAKGRRGILILSFFSCLLPHPPPRASVANLWAYDELEGSRYLQYFSWTLYHVALMVGSAATAKYISPPAAGESALWLGVGAVSGGSGGGGVPRSFQGWWVLPETHRQGLTGIACLPSSPSCRVWDP